MKHSRPGISTQAVKHHGMQSKIVGDIPIYMHILGTAKETDKPKDIRYIDGLIHGYKNYQDAKFTRVKIISSASHST